MPDWIMASRKIQGRTRERKRAMIYTMETGEKADFQLSFSALKEADVVVRRAEEGNLKVGYVCASTLQSDEFSVFTEVFTRTDNGAGWEPIEETFMEKSGYIRAQDAQAEVMRAMGPDIHGYAMRLIRLREEESSAEHAVDISEGQDMSAIVSLDKAQNRLGDFVEKIADDYDAADRESMRINRLSEFGKKTRPVTRREIDEDRGVVSLGSPDDRGVMFETGLIAWETSTGYIAHSGMGVHKAENLGVLAEVLFEMSVRDGLMDPRYLAFEDQADSAGM